MRGDNSLSHVSMKNKGVYRNMLNFAGFWTILKGMLKTDLLRNNPSYTSLLS